MLATDLRLFWLLEEPQVLATATHGKMATQHQQQQIFAPEYTPLIFRMTTTVPSHHTLV